MRFAAAILSGLLLAGAAHAEPRLERPTDVRNDNHFWQLPVHVGGRTAEETFISLDFPYGPYRAHQWPGTYYETAFRGPEVYFAFTDDANIFTVSVDGAPVGRLSKPTGIYRVAGLSAGDHHIRIERLTETQSTKGGFHGFDLPNFKSGAAMPTQPDLPKPTRQIEFIGDSYTVGYGNTSGKRQCTPEELWASTDTQQAFGPLTAKHFNADYQINAFSGRGIVRNYDGFIGDPLPALYPYALYDGKSEYSDPAWRPQIIVIALGGNDFSTPVHATGEKWKNQEELRADYIASYVTFVKTLRARNPQASFLLADYGEPEIIGNIAEVITRLTADGETRAAPFHAGSGFGLNGCDWHLDTADDKRISEALIAYIDAHPELWPEHAPEPAKAP